MLGLAEQVGGAELGVRRRLVGDHHRLGRSGEEVDADAAEELSLGLGDEGVARPDQHVDRRDRLGAQRHGADRLDAAEAVDLVGTAQMHGSDDRGMRRTALWGCGRDDALHACHLGGHHAHMRGADHRIFAARHVAADRIHRDVAMAEDDAGQGLDLDVGHRGLLRLGEAAHLRLGEADIVEVALGDFRDGLFDLLLGQAEGGRLIAIELRGKLADRGVAARLDVLQDALDRGAHLRVVLGARGLGPGGLEMADHEEFPCCCSGERVPPRRQASRDIFSSFGLPETEYVCNSRVKIP